MGIRLIAVDIDGTLLDSKWELPEANRRAVEEAVTRGVEVALVTGRRFDFALPIAKKFGCELTMMVNNGALVRTKDGATHERRLLAREVAREILQATPEYRPGTAVVFDRERENQVIFERIDWEDEDRRGYFERNRRFIAEVRPLEDCLTEDPIQVMFTGPVGAMRDVAERLRGMNGAGTRGMSKRAGRFATAITEYEARNFALVDAVAAEVSKGATLAEWARKRGYGREEVMAIGDNLNDVEMLEFAGRAVVMGNAVEELKRRGWHVTGSADEAGVAEAIGRFVLEG